MSLRKLVGRNKGIALLLLKELELKDKVTQILEQVKVESVKGCWFIRKDWSIYATINGESAHRLMYRAYNGPLIFGKVICHHCDRPGCINPEHLFQGTHSDNHLDAVKKKRKFSSPVIFPIRYKKINELRRKDRDRNIICL